MIAIPSPGFRAGFHILAVLLIFAAPLAGWWMSFRVKRSPTSVARLRTYKLAVVSLLAGSLAAFLLVPPPMFFDLPVKNRGVDWLPSRELISIFAVALVLVTALPVLLAGRNRSFQASLAQQLQELRNLLPRGRQERIWFAAAVICGSLGEEVLYRAFLLHYLHVFPWRLDIATSLLIACMVFGAVHLYQGVSGLLQHVLLALGLCVLFLTTRSLLLPMALHLLISLRLVMLLPAYGSKAE